MEYAPKHHYLLKYIAKQKLSKLIKNVIVSRKRFLPHVQHAEKDDKTHVNLTKLGTQRDSETILLMFLSPSHYQKKKNENKNAFFWLWYFLSTARVAAKEWLPYLLNPVKQ